MGVVLDIDEALNPPAQDGDAPRPSRRLVALNMIGAAAYVAGLGGFALYAMWR